MDIISTRPINVPRLQRKGVFNKIPKEYAKCASREYLFRTEFVYQVIIVYQRTANIALSKTEKKFVYNASRIIMQLAMDKTTYVNFKTLTI